MLISVSWIGILRPSLLCRKIVYTVANKSYTSNLYLLSTLSYIICLLTQPILHSKTESHSSTSNSRAC
jgi:hypothetical protein